MPAPKSVLSVLWMMTYFTVSLVPGRFCLPFGIRSISMFGKLFSCEHSITPSIKSAARLFSVESE
jgi:hypothetical protein